MSGAELDLSARAAAALGQQAFRILVLEETVAQREARIAELEAALAARPSDDLAERRAKKEQPPGA